MYSVHGTTFAWFTSWSAVVPRFSVPLRWRSLSRYFLAALGLAMAIYLISVREPRSLDPQTTKGDFMTPKPDNGIVTIPSHYSVDETVKRIEETLAAKDVKLFALIDHSGEAEKAGLQMRPTKLLI